MNKILVTGATGFIGKHVTQKLINGYKKQFRVIATSSGKNVPPDLSNDQVTYIPFDLRDFNSSVDYFDFFQQPDIMIHLAWEGLPNYKEGFHLEENLPRHFSFLKNLIENGLNNLSVTGTCLEYGKLEGMLSEDLPVTPEVPYATAKNELRMALESLKKDHNFSLKWIRLFYMWGQGQNPNSLLSQLDEALKNNQPVFNMSGGEQVRDYLPVEEMADYIIRIALQKKIEGVINCCSGKPVTVKQFVESYLKSKNRKINLNLGYYSYPDYEPMAFWGSNDKLKRILHNE